MCIRGRLPASPPRWDNQARSQENTTVRREGGSTPVPLFSLLELLLPHPRRPDMRHDPRVRRYPHGAFRRTCGRRMHVHVSTRVLTSLDLPDTQSLSSLSLSLSLETRG
jgi:hypothetical protein